MFPARLRAAPNADRSLVGLSRNGRTDPANAGPACNRHNLEKIHGFTVHRDEHGRWPTHRRDGTEITAA